MTISFSFRSVRSTVAALAGAVLFGAAASGFAADANSAGGVASVLPLTDASAQHLTDDPITATRIDELRRAVRTGNAAAAKRLLASGLTPNSLMENGDTLFTYAMRSDAPETAKVVMEAEGFDPNALNRFGETPLMLAVFKGNEAIFKRLLELGASTEGVPGRWTPLHYAATEGRRTFVEYLIEHGADVNAQTKAGVTPLMMAARKPSRVVVTQLLRAGAYRDYCTDKGMSPADFARNAGDDELAEYLAIERCAVKGRRSSVRIGTVETPSNFPTR